MISVRVQFLAPWEHRENRVPPQGYWTVDAGKYPPVSHFPDTVWWVRFAGVRVELQYEPQRKQGNDE